MTFWIKPWNDILLHWKEHLVRFPWDSYLCIERKVAWIKGIELGSLMFRIELSCCRWWIRVNSQSGMLAIIFDINYILVNRTYKLALLVGQCSCMYHLHNTPIFCVLFKSSSQYNSIFFSTFSGAPFIRPMTNVTATASRSLTIRCYVTGYPIQSLIWLRGA